jgi:CelD/BcsL family acetyltransferase involved in cellulose biosynthesis
MRFRVLELNRAEDRAAWAALWHAWPGREVMAHPEYARLFSRSCDRVVCPVGEADGYTILFPLVLRPLAAEPWARPGEDRCDAISPYGYGGPFAWGGRPQDPAPFWDGYAAWARGARLVSTFVRLSLFPEQLAPLPFRVEAHSPNVVVDLTGGPEAVRRRYESSARRWLRIAQRAGVQVVVDPGGERLDDFLAVYTHTMRRRDASTWYHFPRSLFEALAARLPGCFVFFHAVAGGRVVCTDLTLVSSERVYAFLGGTLEDAFDLGPNYLVKHRIVEWAAAAGKRQYVLGGGHESGDGLLRHKRSFAPRGEVPFRLATAVHDEGAYLELCQQRAASAAREGQAWSPRPRFFPAYNA